jgi:hypothetical protein
MTSSRDRVAACGGLGDFYLSDPDAGQLFARVHDFFRHHARVP